MRKHEFIILIGVGTAALILSGIRPYDRVTWLLEVLPILIGVPLLAAVHLRFQFTPLAYRLVFIHCLILML